MNSSLARSATVQSVVVAVGPLWVSESVLVWVLIQWRSGLMAGACALRFFHEDDDHDDDHDSVTRSVGCAGLLVE